MGSKRIDEAEDIEPRALKGEVADPIENNQSNEDT
jgi:hypothetical protein